MKSSRKYPQPQLQYFDVSAAMTCTNGQSCRKSTKLPICTLPLLNKKMYVINTAPLVQSAMRNKTLEFGARIEEIAQAMGVDVTITRRLVRENAIEEISKITIAALSGDNLLNMNLNALHYIGDRFNAVKPGSPVEISDFYHWTRDIIGTATTRALYGEHSPFNNHELVDSIWSVTFFVVSKNCMIY